MSSSALSLRRAARTPSPGAGIVDRRLEALDARVRAANKPPLWRRIVAAAFTLVIVAGTVFLWPDRLGGVTNFVVVRGTSMEPEYHIQDVVVARARDSYEVGDIVVFRIPEGVGEGQLVIHRLVGQREDGTWITQGDNRSTPDQFELEDGDLEGAPVFVLPQAGRILALVSNTFVVATAFGLFVIVLLWPRKKPVEPVLVASYTASEPHPLDIVDLETLTPVSQPVPVLSATVVALVAALDEENEVSDGDVAVQAEEWLQSELQRLGIDS